MILYYTIFNIFCQFWQTWLQRSRLEALKPPRSLWLVQHHQPAGDSTHEDLRSLCRPHSNYQHHVEVYLRYMGLWLCCESGTVTSMYHNLPYHTIPYHTIPYHTIPSHAMPCHTIPYHTIPYHTIPYHTIPYRTIQYHAIPCHITLYYTLFYFALPYYTVLSILGYTILHSTMPYYIKMYTPLRNPNLVSVPLRAQALTETCHPDSGA